jgi:asparagine synthase (glutamine-hydrolysing)
MSGIVGLWNLDGAPVDAAVLSKMNRTLRHRGPDGEGYRVSDSVGFACQNMWVTPEEIGETQPLAGRGGVMIAMDGRIDNRDELLAALGLPNAASDATCVLTAYQAWEERFAERLNGDFALAVFDEPRRRLILARDSIGIRPLYYFHSDRLFVFASEIKALLAHPHIEARPDDEGLADFMLVSSRPVDRQEITCFAGISALVPAHVAIVTPTRKVTRRYWDFDTGHVLTFRSFGEYVEAFQERFAEAVRRRVRSARPVAVSLSGGLDSSSIFCQAQTLRRAGSADCPEPIGISYTGAEGSDADETRYLAEIEREYGIGIERFPIEPVTGLAPTVAEQVQTIEAPFLDHLWEVTSALNRRASARGSRVLLSGSWGDQVLFSSAYLADLFRRLAWREIRRHTREYSHYFGKAEAHAIERRIAADIVRHYVPGFMVRPLKWARLKLSTSQPKKLWFSDPFLQHALRFAARPATIGKGFHSVQARAIYLEARSKYHVHCMEWNNKAGAWHGLNVAFPYLDRDLLAFLMATPGEVQNRNGIPRALLREAMRGILPEAVRSRKGKADFTRVVNAGVARNASEITRALSSACLGVRLGYFDAHRLAPEVARLSAGLDGADCVKSWDLADLFGLEVWLQVFLVNQSVWRTALESQE